MEMGQRLIDLLLIFSKLCCVLPFRIVLCIYGKMWLFLQQNDV